MVITDALPLTTTGNTDILNITREVQEMVTRHGLRHGVVTIFCPGSTGALTTLEYESGVLHDLRALLDRLIPPDAPYRHHLRWGDDNGHAHLRAALLGPSLTVPVVDGRLILGTWQQLVFIDFDTTPRERRLIVTLLGE